MPTTTWNRHHILTLADFTTAEYNAVLQTAASFQEVLSRRTKKVPTLQGQVVANLFFESSTRTRSSFEIAAKRLSADTLNFSAATSSMTKGETILNAGDGQHEHPSQGLLDLFTICSLIDSAQPRIELLKDKKIVIVGDILHSRVARSNIWSLIASGAEVHLVAPPTLLPKFFAEYLGIDKNNHRLFTHWQLEPALENADFVMTLRLQKERMTANLLPSLREYHQLFGITRTKLKLCKPNVKVLHPGPVNRGVEISSDLMDDPQFSLIQSQVTSGVAVRMALLYFIGSGRA